MHSMFMCSDKNINYPAPVYNVCADIAADTSSVLIYKAKCVNSHAVMKTIMTSGSLHLSTDNIWT